MFGPMNEFSKPHEIVRIFGASVEPNSHYNQVQAFSPGTIRGGVFFDLSLRTLICEKYKF